MRHLSLLTHPANLLSRMALRQPLLPRFGSVEEGILPQAVSDSFRKSAPHKTEWSGSHMPARYSGYILKTDEDWRHFWGKVYDMVVPQGFDADKHTAVVIALGDRPSSGYGIEVASGRMVGDEFIVDYLETRPEEGMMTASMMTQPYLVKLFPKTNARIVFHKMSEEEIKVYQRLSAPMLTTPQGVTLTGRQLLFICHELSQTSDFFLGFSATQIAEILGKGVLGNFLSDVTSALNLLKHRGLLSASDGHYYTFHVTDVGRENLEKTSDDDVSLEAAHTFLAGCVSHFKDINRKIGKMVLNSFLEEKGWMAIEKISRGKLHRKQAAGPSETSEVIKPVRLNQHQINALSAPLVMDARLRDFTVFEVLEKMAKLNKAMTEGEIEKAFSVPENHLNRHPQARIIRKESERTLSYDEFINLERDPYFTSMADLYVRDSDLGPGVGYEDIEQFSRVASQGYSLWRTLESLELIGLVENVGDKQSECYQLTDAGREAVRKAGTGEIVLPKAELSQADALTRVNDKFSKPFGVVQDGNLPAVTNQRFSPARLAQLERIRIFLSTTPLGETGWDVYQRLKKLEHSRWFLADLLFPGIAQAKVLNSLSPAECDAKLKMLGDLEKAELVYRIKNGKKPDRWGMNNQKTWTPENLPAPDGITDQDRSDLIQLDIDALDHQRTLRQQELEVFAVECEQGAAACTELETRFKTALAEAEAALTKSKAPETSAKEQTTLLRESDDKALQAARLKKQLDLETCLQARKVLAAQAGKVAFQKWCDRMRVAHDAYVEAQYQLKTKGLNQRIKGFMADIRGGQNGQEQNMDVLTRIADIRSEFQRSESELQTEEVQLAMQAEALLEKMSLEERLKTIRQAPEVPEDAAGLKTEAPEALLKALETSTGKGAGAVDGV